MLQNIQGAKQQLDAALGVVTGQAPAGGVGSDLDANLGAATNLDAQAGDDLDVAADDLDAAAADAADELDAEEPEAGSLGRARR